MGESLAPRQARFVEEYLIDLNGTQAAIRAGYSPNSAEVEASRLLRNVKVAKAVETAIANRSQRTEITADRVLTELAKIGFADIRKAVKWGSRLVERPEETVPSGESLEAQPQGGSLKRRRKGDDESDAFYVTTVEMADSTDLDPDTAAAVAEVAQTKEGVRIKFHDKQAALLNIGRHLGMFSDKIEHSGSVTIIAQDHDEQL